MSYGKKILCLANSYKNGGRCIAGREVVGTEFGQWIRPVGPRETHEIRENEMYYMDGRPASVLDYIGIVFRQPQPLFYQTENHLIARDEKWHFAGVASWAEVQRAVDKLDGPLWVNGYASYHGKNDRIPEAEACTLKSSLHLIRPTEAVLLVRDEGVEFGESRLVVRSRFRFDGIEYILKVTDPVVIREFGGYGEGEYRLSNALFCISLSELYEGCDGNRYAYKLIAAIITPERCGG